MISRRNFNQTIGKLAGLSLAASLISASANAGVQDMAASDFRMPDEALPHFRTFMQWPVNRTVYPDRYFLQLVQQSIADIANTIVEFEPVVMLMDERFQKPARRMLSEKIEFWNIATDDLWCRDSGPVFVKNNNGELAVSHIKFNGWGNKQVHPNDGKIARLIAERLELPLIDSGLFGEAGGVEFDGAGTLMAHESSWIIANRNKGSRAQIEERLIKAVGGKKLIWAPGIKGADITDYHIDSLARFPKPGTVLIQLPEMPIPGEQWSLAAFETYEILKRSTGADGNKFNMVIIPEPVTPRVKSDDFVASYVNYYVCNDAVIAAQFGDRDSDKKAKDALALLFPDREIITLDVDAIGEIGGGIHCATQQQPMI